MRNGNKYQVVVSTLSTMNTFHTNDIARVKRIIFLSRRKANYISSQVFKNGKKHYYDVRKY